MPTCLQAAAAVHSSPSNSAGMEFWAVLQPAGAPPLARAEFDTTAAPASMCAGVRVRVRVRVRVS